MSNRITNSPTANMFGLESCPQCGDEFRWPMVSDKNLAKCDACGLEETDDWSFCTVCKHPHYIKGHGPACPTCDCVENESD